MTSGTPTADGPAGRRLRTRHPHCRHNWQQRKAERIAFGHRAQCAPDRPESARQEGTGLTSSVINAVTFATEQRAALGIDIINLSLGHPIYDRSRPIRSSGRGTTVHAGIVVIVSSATTE
jgi:hypothetical protein